MNKINLENALKVANLPTLLMVLHQISGNEKWLNDPYRPKRSPGMDDLDSGGFSEAIQQEIREAASDILLAWYGGVEKEIPSPNIEHLHYMTEVCMGEEVPIQFAEMISEQAGFLEDKEQREFSEPLLDSERTVGVIGAGVSGLLMARQLRNRGIKVQIFDKNTQIGGCWVSNAYPGCGVDTPSYLYSFSFYGRDWSTYFGKRKEVLGYIQDMAKQENLEQYVRYNHEVISAKWDTAVSKWMLTMYTPQGVHTHSVDFLVSAVGQLNLPQIPHFQDIEKFENQVFHSSTWTEEADIKDKKVIVVGGGASAMQIVPAIVDQVDSLKILQRSKQWVAPNKDYFRSMDPRIHWLMKNLPYYHSWFRARLAWIHNDRVHKSLQIDPSWDGNSHSINATNNAHRKFFTQYLESELEGRPELIDKTLPDFPPFGKRMLLDNGWFKALRKDNVELITDGIQRFTATGVVDKNGNEHLADVVVLATGFKARDFLVEIDVEGPESKISDVWGKEDAKAYLGMTVPNFPNLFMMYGPNTNLGHGGSFITIAECQAHYLGELLEETINNDISTIQVRADVYNEYNDRVDEAHEKMIWSVDGINSWYRNSSGRVVTNTPWRVMDYWKMTRDPKLTEYVVNKLTEVKM